MSSWMSLPPSPRSLFFARAMRGSTSASSSTSQATRSRSAATCSPAGSSPRWSCATPSCASSQARSATPARAPRSPSAQALAATPSTRTTRGQRSTAAGACPRCCCRAITSASLSGAGSAAANVPSDWEATPRIEAAPPPAAGDRPVAHPLAGSPLWRGGRPLPWVPRAVRTPLRATVIIARPRQAMSSVIETIERAQLRRLPSFAPGDRVKVHFQVIEGSRRRIQVFEGVVIKRQGHGARETFTVRKQSFGVGVERSFPVHSPKIERVELAARGDVRRAKLYYLRDRVGKRARVRERRYAGPEQAVEPGLLEEPVAATDAEGLTAEETVMRDADAAPEDAAEAASSEDDAAKDQAAQSDAPKEESTQLEGAQAE